MILKDIGSIRAQMVEKPGVLIATKFMMIPGPLQAGNHLGNGITLKAKMNLDEIFQRDSALKIIGELMFQGMTLILIGLTLERTMVLYTLL